MKKEGEIFVFFLRLAVVEAGRLVFLQLAI
jgi:hypothetical protein